MLTDAALIFLREMPLVELNLVNCHKMTDAGLEHLFQLRQLKRVGLKGCFRISDGGLESL